MARPQKPVNEKLLRDLASILCTMEEMADILGVSKDTLERRYAAIIKVEQQTGRSSLRRHQYKLACAGNATMLIWLGKQWLGQSDKIAQDITATVTTDEHKQVLDEAKRVLRDGLNERKGKKA